MNVRLLLKIKEAILAQPDLYYQGDWFNKTACGTQACIAGWACKLDDEKEFNDIVSSYEPYRVDEIGQELLGLNKTLRDFLFVYWHEPYKTRLSLAVGNRPKAEVAAEYIDYFIEKYGND